VDLKRAQPMEQVENAAGRTRDQGQRARRGLVGTEPRSWGGSSNLGLYLRGDPGLLCPELGTGWERLALMPVLVCRCRAGRREDLASQGSGGSAG